MPDRTLRYILTAQDKGASAALEKTATSGEKAASRIGSAFSRVGGKIGGELGQVFDEIGSGLDQLGEHGISAGAKLTLMGAGVTTLGVSLMQLGSNEKQATDQLKAAIDSTGNSYSDFSDQIEKTIKHQENFGHSAADTDEALRKLTTATQSPQKALDLMGVTADLAAAKHISLSEASQLLTRVLGGTGGKVLAQYGITMKKNADGTKDVDGAVAALGDRLKGQASASVDNFSGKVGIVLTKLHDWGAEMGQKFGPAITGAGVAITATGTVMQLFQARAAAAAAASEALAAGEVTAAVGADTLGISMARALGPLGLVVAATVAVGAATGRTGDYISNLAKSGKGYTDTVNTTADALKTNLLTALQQTGSGQQELVTQTVNAGQALGGVQAAVFSSGQSWDVFGKAVTGTDEDFKNYIDTLKAHNDAAGHDKAATRDAIGDMTKLRGAYLDANAAAGQSTTAIALQDRVLAGSKETVGQVITKWNDAWTAAHTLTAQIGYMSNALDKLSGNAVTAELGQLKLTDAWAVGKDADSELTQQVKAHGSSLQANTADGRSNREWLLQQIQAINAQALMQAKATGSIKVGTDSLQTNEAALRTSAHQAGLTDAEVNTLINTYHATPKDVKTSIAQQGAQAVIDKLGEIEVDLHKIADPQWAAKVSFLASNTSMPLAAEGGLLQGPGGPKSDNLLLWGSPGEYMVNAEATRKNLPLLQQINKGVNGFAGGGLLGALNIGLSQSLPDLGDWARKFLPPAITGIPGGPGPTSAGISALQDYAFSLFRYYGWDQSQLGSLIALWNGESGWNPAAYNASSGATGIPQSLPASKMASAGADYLTNGATQIRWGENYISQVYGSPSAAYGAWLSRSPHWYGQGAWDVPGDQLAFLHRKELVMDPRSAEKFRSGAAASIMVASGAITIYAAPGMDEGRVADQAFARLREWVVDEQRRAAKGGRA